jgi:hypothetical protein
VKQTLRVGHHCARDKILIHPLTRHLKKPGQVGLLAATMKMRTHVIHQCVPKRGFRPWPQGGTSADAPGFNTPPGGAGGLLNRQISKQP